MLDSTLSAKDSSFGNFTPSDPERELLTLCLQRPSAQVTDRIARSLEKDIRWSRFLLLADRNDVVPLAYSALSLFADRVPRTIFAKLRERHATVTSWNLVLASELGVVDDLLRCAAIPAVSFKGPALAAALYGHLWLRHCRDLDIFVGRESVADAVRILRAHGYRNDPASTCLDELDFESQKDVVLQNPVTGAYIELHWAVCERAFDPNLHAANLWQETRQVRVFDASVSIPSPENMLFLFSVHGSRHYWNSLKWICDIAQLLRAYPELDWLRAFSLADVFSRRRTLLIAVKLAHDLLGASLPQSVHLPIEGEPGLSLLANQIVQRLFADNDDLFPLANQSLFSSRRAAETDLSKKLFRLRSNDMLRDRLSYSARLIRDFIRPDVEDKPFGERSGLKFLLWTTQPLKLIRAYGVRFFLRTSKELLAAIIR